MTSKEKMSTHSGYTERIKPGEGKIWHVKPSFIGHLDIELTERCDNNCIHCSINISEDDTRKNRELNTDTWKKIIREAADLGVLSIRFTGGEPLLREDFSQLYLYTRKLGIKVILFTNARKITPGLARLFSRIPPLEKIEVSVYGMRESTYERISRVPGSYEESKAGIELLRESGVPFLVKGIRLPDTADDSDEFKSWADSLPDMHEPPSYSMFFELRERRDSETKNRLISSLRMDPEEGVNVLSGTPGYHHSLEEFCGRFCFPPGPDLFPCGAGLSGSVDPYGFIHPCLTLKADSLSYDLRRGSLKDALGNHFPEKLRITATNPDYLRRCARCFLHGLCQQCPAKAWSEHGTFDTPVEYFCRVTHAQARRLGLLNAGEKSWKVTDWKTRLNRMKERENGKN